MQERRPHRANAVMWNGGYWALEPEVLTRNGGQNACSMCRGCRLQSVRNFPSDGLSLANIETHTDLAAIYAKTFGLVIRIRVRVEPPMSGICVSSRLWRGVGRR